MRHKKVLIAALTLFVGMIIATNSSIEAAPLDTGGDVTVEESKITPPLDPENPLNPVNPGPSPVTDGPLRIDFSSSINFSGGDINDTDRKYLGLAQLFHDETTPRGNYVQVTDVRPGNLGWSLLLKQETQFKNKDSVELNGSVLSFDKGWASSGAGGPAPAVFSDTISIDSIGNSYSLASAAKGTGKGTWLISFGASETNPKGQTNTLKPLVDKSGQPVNNVEFEKQAFTNSAISLTIPSKTTILPGDYTTSLTWILQATP